MILSEESHSPINEIIISSYILFQQSTFDMWPTSKDSLKVGIFPSFIAGGFFTSWATREALLSFFQSLISEVQMCLKASFIVSVTHVGSWLLKGNPIISGVTKSLVLSWLKYSLSEIEQVIFLPRLPGGSVVKNPPAMQETQEMGVWSQGQEDPLEEDMATHSGIARKIPWTEESGRLWSVGSQSVRHNWSDWACMRELAPSFLVLLLHVKIGIMISYLDYIIWI